MNTAPFDAWGLLTPDGAMVFLGGRPAMFRTRKEAESYARAQNWFLSTSQGVSVSYRPRPARLRTDTVRK